ALAADAAFRNVDQVKRYAFIFVWNCHENARSKTVEDGLKGCVPVTAWGADMTGAPPRQGERRDL
ncbi:hypothetical protein, partial [Brucella sp. 10RB9212]|uniref:hypothetical protein n=1 Tax=Brucella sp. 10RB9212 TaxID=1844034 RepID=UPI0019D51C69